MSGLLYETSDYYNAEPSGYKSEYLLITCYLLVNT